MLINCISFYDMSNCVLQTNFVCQASWWMTSIMSRFTQIDELVLLLLFDIYNKDWYINISR